MRVKAFHDKSTRMLSIGTSLLLATIFLSSCAHHQVDRDNVGYPTNSGGFDGLSEAEIVIGISFNNSDKPEILVFDNQGNPADLNIDLVNDEAIDFEAFALLSAFQFVGSECHGVTGGGGSGKGFCHGPPGHGPH